MQQNRYQDLSELSKIQHNRVRYQNSVRPKYQDRRWISEHQYQIYKTAMLGLKAYSKQELYRMSIIAKKRIVEFYKKAQIILNRWKQELVNEMFEQLCSLDCFNFEYNPFQKVFDETVIGIKKFGHQTEDTVECTLTFQQLKISREQIIQKLIEERILPNNFYKLQNSWF